MGYCGCGTRANKIRWIVGGILMVLGLGFLIASVVTGIIAQRDFQDCLDELEKEGKITRSQKEDVEDRNPFDRDSDNPFIDDCFKDHIRSSPSPTFFWLMFGFFIAGSIQFYIMCCCAKKPQQLQQQQVFIAQPYAQQPPSYGQQPAAYGQPVYDASNIQMTKV